ncbi:nucleotidyltransferase family protein [Cellvibrio sp. UBA7671]|uniref:nucleotidyltransferase family protein n=1 Tax=Cellvibrio sp. UBA7671 TaxID=1946312 RepID=UPI0039C89D0E
MCHGGSPLDLGGDIERCFKEISQMRIYGRLRLCSDSKLVLASPFNIPAIFDGYITHNRNREKEIFLSCVKDKNWLELWPKLQLKISTLYKALL